MNGKSLVARKYYFRAEKHKNKEEGDRKHNIQNSWVFGLCPSSDIRKIFLQLS
jgi:hypothetical protein